MPPELSYEEQRAQNIADNEALLKSLGLDVPVIPKAPPKPKAKPKPKPKAVEKAAYVDKGEDSESDEEYAPKPTRSGRQPPRRSGREVRALDRLGSEEYPQRNAERLGVRTQDPKQFGHIPGVEVGTWWPSRMQCSTAAIHAPTVAGISGNAEVGAWSVALSGGYPDDVDLGDAFTYTGSGGRDLKGTREKPKNLRTAPQTFDQTFDNNYNASLKKSAETKNPVRVIRGFKLDSVYAPAEGYRYDGLYVVEKAWMAPGLTNGLKVCKYAFRRMAGQPPLPRNDEEAPEKEEDEEEGVDADDAADLESEEGSPHVDAEEPEEVEEARESKASAPSKPSSSRRSGGTNGSASAPPLATPSKSLSRRSSRLSNGGPSDATPSKPLSRRTSRLSNVGPSNADASAAAPPLSPRSSRLSNGATSGPSSAQASPVTRRARISHIEIPSLKASVNGKRRRSTQNISTQNTDTEADTEAEVPAKRSRPGPARGRKESTMSALKNGKGKGKEGTVSTGARRSLRVAASR